MYMNREEFARTKALTAKNHARTRAQRFARLRRERRLPLPLTPSSGINILRRNSCQNIETQTVTGKIFKTNDLIVSFPGATL